MYQWDAGVFSAPAAGFDGAATFFCGQCFRWQTEPDGGFCGVVRGRLRHLTVADGILRLWPCGKEEAGWFYHYLALDEDWPGILSLLCRNPVLRCCVAARPGIRVLHQDLFETLITFIISQNNNIPRIRAITGRLCEGWGEKLAEGEYAFPTPESLAGLTEEELGCLRAGWRAGYILDAARKVADGTVTAEKLAALPYPEARGLLMSIRGVGPKVADCVLLFGADKKEAFPMDVWMKRAMAALLPRGLPRYLLPYGGIAQQFIFDYARTNPDIFEKKAKNPR